MSFFKRQQVDEIGILGVKLQKLLIFFMILNVFNFFHLNVICWLSALFYMVILYCGFTGAYKRRERLLQLYVVVSILMIVLSTLAVVFIVAGNAHRNHEEVENNDNTPTDVVPAFTPNATVTNNNNNDKDIPTQKPSSALPPTNASSPLMELRPASSVSNGTDDTTVVVHERVSAGIILISVLGFVFSLIVFALKISSLVLASRMIRMLRERQAHNLAHPIAPRKQTPTSQPMYQPVMYIPVPVQPNGAPFTSVMYNPYVTPFQPQSSAPRQQQV